MPSFEHLVKTPYVPTFRSTKTESLFDLSTPEEITHSWNVDIPVEDTEWNIGVIVGPSGSGKTSIGTVAFGEDAYVRDYDDWPYDKSLLDAFPEQYSVEEITQVLSSVGFSSPPAWLQPFHTLSNGQKFRVNMARVLLDDRECLVVDEYSSVIDRTVAKVGSVAIAKTARRKNKKLVLLSCHYDILEWLEPDWIYHVDTAQFNRGSLCRPSIEISINRVGTQAWRLFSKHHYLSHSLIKHSECYCAYVMGEPAAFFAFVPDTRSLGSMNNVIRAHRTVVLPDYQGLGISKICQSLICDYYLSKGKIVKSITSHPAMINARSKDNKFRLCSPVKFQTLKGVSYLTKGSISGMGRVTATFQYVGEDNESTKST